MVKSLAAAAALLIGLTAPAAQAAVVSFNFAGTISALISDDSSHTFSANFAVGDAVSGSFSFDTGAAGVEVFPGTLKTYASSFAATVSGKAFSGASEYRIFDNSGSGDGFSIINETGTYSAPVLGPLVARTFFLQFLGMPIGTLSDLDIIADPSALFSLATNVAPHGFRLDSTLDNSFGGAYFNITSVTGVPEPGSGALAALGLWLAGAATRRPPRRPYSARAGNSTA
jgi:hypothetical protein